MAVTVLYRLSSGEVMKISTKGQDFSSRDTRYWAVLTDPPRPDGDDVVDLSGDEPGPRRQLGFAKIWDGGTVRNATQPEIDGWQAAEDADLADEDAEEARQFLEGHPRFRRVLKAMIKLIVAENNETNGKLNAFIAIWEQHRTDIANANNLSDVKTSTAALSSQLADLKDSLTLAQAVTAIRNQVDTSD